jgi:antitoxin component of MazEF toxin-antitoxin module
VKIAVRRIGNSLGVILPRSVLDDWGVDEGGYLELSARALHPPGGTDFTHSSLDELKRQMALAIVGEFTAAQIRAQILANLHRWKRQGVWVSAYDEWHEIARSADDGRLFAAMLGRDEDAVRLRQSAPYAGLLKPSAVKKLNEEAGR